MVRNKEYDEFRIMDQIAELERKYKFLLKDFAIVKNMYFVETENLKERVDRLECYLAAPDKRS